MKSDQNNMTIAYWCILIAAILPYGLVFVAKAGAKGFDNRAPRDWYARAEGFRQRAIWAQQNSYEIFPLFAAGVIIAHLTATPQGWIDGLAIGFVASRIAFAICYIADLHLARSLVWTFGFACCVALFIIAA